MTEHRFSNLLSIYSLAGKTFHTRPMSPLPNDDVQDAQRGRMLMPTKKDTSCSLDTMYQSQLVDPLRRVSRNASGCGQASHPNEVPERFMSEAAKRCTAGYVECTWAPMGP